MGLDLATQAASFGRIARENIHGEPDASLPSQVRQSLAYPPFERLSVDTPETNVFPTKCRTTPR